MKKASAIECLRNRLETTRNHNYYSEGYKRGLIDGLETALFFLGEKQAVREHRAAMAKIYEENKNRVAT